MACFAVRCADRDGLKAHLEANGIGTNIHYPTPMHLHEAYKELNIPQGAYPVAEELSNTELSIPMYYGMEEDEVSYVIDCINRFARR